MKFFLHFFFRIKNEFSSDWDFCETFFHRPKNKLTILFYTRCNSVNYRQQRSNQFLFRWIWTLFNKSFNFDSAEFWQFCNETLDFTVSLSRLFTISFVFYWFLRTVVKSLTSVIDSKKPNFLESFWPKNPRKFGAKNRQQFHKKIEIFQVMSQTF